MNLFKNWRRRAPDRTGAEQLGFRVAPNVKASSHADGVVLIHLGKGIVFSANRAGAMIWNGAVERQSLEQVSHSISHEFHISPQDARQDAAEFLEQLAAEGLLISEAS